MGDSGGANTDCAGTSPYGCGALFKITPEGAPTTLHNFSPADGYAVNGGLVQDHYGNYNGTTQKSACTGAGWYLRVPRRDNDDAV